MHKNLFITVLIASMCFIASCDKPPSTGNTENGSDDKREKKKDSSNGSNNNLDRGQDGSNDSNDNLDKGQDGSDGSSDNLDKGQDGNNGSNDNLGGEQKYSYLFTQDQLKALIRELDGLIANKAPNFSTFFQSKVYAVGINNEAFKDVRVSWVIIKEFIEALDQLTAAPATDLKLSKVEEAINNIIIATSGWTFDTKPDVIDKDGFGAGARRNSMSQLEVKGVTATVTLQMKVGEESFKLFKSGLLKIRTFITKSKKTA